MSNPETPSSSDLPEFNGFDPDALDYLQELSDAFDRLPMEIEERRLAYMNELYHRKQEIEHALQSLDEDEHESYRIIRIQGLRAQESNTRLAFEHYANIIFLLPERKHGNRARALETALRSADESQAPLNQRSIGFTHHFDKVTLTDMIDEVIATTDSIEATRRACKAYESVVKPAEALLQQLDSKNPGL